MKRYIILAALLMTFLPTMAMAQTKKTKVPNESCCGQAEEATVSREQLLMETQQNLQAILMLDSKSKKLKAGDYFISEGPEGCEFRAVVSRSGIVDAWYIADLDGTMVARIKANGGGGLPGTSTGVQFCFEKYSADIAACAYLESSWPNRYQLCLNGAWDALWGCLGRSGGSVSMR